MLFCTVVILLTAVLAVGIRPRSMRWLKGAGLASIGVGTGIVIGLFAIGPGNLWPIVLGVNALILAPALVVGSALGELVFSMRVGRL